MAGRTRESYTAPKRLAGARGEIPRSNSKRAIARVFLRCIRFDRRSLELAGGRYSAAVRFFFSQRIVFQGRGLVLLLESPDIDKLYGDVVRASDRTRFVLLAVIMREKLSVILVSF